MDILLISAFVAVTGHIILTWLRNVNAGRQASKRAEAPHKAETLPPVSVLVPAWQEALVLHTTLYQLQTVIYPEWELIIIAGGADGTYDRAVELTRTITNCQVQVIEQRPRGKNAALNQGLSRASYDLIVILDGDTLVEPDWLTNLVGALDPQTAAACGNFSPLRQTWVSNLEQMEEISSYLIHGHVTLQGSGSIVIRRTVLEQIGGFPEAVKVGVDWDLDARLNDLHLPKVFAQTARVRTQRPATLKQFWKNEVRWRRAHLQWLWRRRSDVLSVLRSSQFYIVALIPLGLLLLIVGTLIVGWLNVTLALAKLGLLFLWWVSARRAALVGEVAAYTANYSWYRQLLTPPTLLLTSFVASWWALATARRQTIHFKGPRN